MQYLIPLTGHYGGTLRSILVPMSYFLCDIMLQSYGLLLKGHYAGTLRVIMIELNGISLCLCATPFRVLSLNHLSYPNCIFGLFYHTIFRIDLFYQSTIHGNFIVSQTFTLKQQGRATLVRRSTHHSRSQLSPSGLLIKAYWPNMPHAWETM